MKKDAVQLPEKNICKLESTKNKSPWAMFSLALFVIHLAFPTKGICQTFLNGDFENNTAVVNQINIGSNAAYNGFMANSIAYGTTPNMDIMTAPTYGVPQSGSWFVGMTGGGTDAISLETTVPLTIGNSYTISFYAKSWGSFSAASVQIGISNTPNTFGALLYTTPVIGANPVWAQYSFTFIAPSADQYITISQTGILGNWLNLDNFQFVNPCDATWTLTTACSTDPPIDLDALITGDIGGTWSGTGVTGSNFDPSSGSQSITYTAPAGCDSTATIVVTTTADATWTLPANLCTNSPQLDLNTLVTGTTGGTWSGTGVTGNMFDPSTGTQNITYTVGTVPCDDALAQSIIVNPTADGSWTVPSSICANDGPIDLNTLITGTAGGTWSGTGVTGSSFDPAGLSGNISITYAVGTTPCDATVVQDINVTALADPTWVAPVNLCTSSPIVDLDATISGTMGGTWSGTGLTGSNFDPATGSQTVTYTVGAGTCQQSSALTINVAIMGDASWTTLDMCLSDPPIDLTGNITGDLGGTWTGTGITGSTFDPNFGSQSITYTVGPAGCEDVITQTITVIDLQVNVTGTNISCFGMTDGSAQANVTGATPAVTYSWNTIPVQNTSIASNLSAGNYSVTVTDGSCSQIVNIDIIEPAELTANLTANDACLPELGTATVTPNGGVPGYTYLWDNSSQTSETATNLDSNMQVVTITDNSGCTYVDSIFVHVFPQHSVSARNDTTINRGDCVRLDVSSGNTYTWSPDYGDLTCTDCQDPIACPEVETDYCVTVTDTNGCYSNDCVKISIEIVCGEVFVPNAFSPNNDGENDLECLYSDCMDSFVFTIYNRWGEKVFETADMSICWDGTWKGKELNSAVFVYRLDGILITGEEISQKGNISLIR